MTPKIKTIFNRNIYGPSTNRPYIKGWETPLQSIIRVYGLLHPMVSPLRRHIFRGTTHDAVTSNAFEKPQRITCPGPIIAYFITPIISDKKHKLSSNYAVLSIVLSFHALPSTRFSQTPSMFFT